MLKPVAGVWHPEVGPEGMAILPALDPPPICVVAGTVNKPATSVIASAQFPTLVVVVKQERKSVVPGPTLPPPPFCHDEPFHTRCKLLVTLK
jgi:hypothetical protein